MIAFDVTQYNFYHILLFSSKPCVQPSTFKGREPHEGGKAGRPGSLALIPGEQLPHTAKQGLALTAFFIIPVLEIFQLKIMFSECVVVCQAWKAFSCKNFMLLN